MEINKSKWAAFIVGFIPSFLIWIYSEQLFGQVGQITDDDLPLYFLIILATAVITGLLSKDAIVGPLGIYLGQLLAITFVYIHNNFLDSNLWPLTPFLLAIVSAPTLIANAVGAIVRKLIENKFNRSSQ